MWISPKLPDFDVTEWRDRPFPERVRAICTAWATDGYGAPVAVYLAYAGKIGLYVTVWAWFCTFSPGHELSDLSRWWASDTAFTKAILWTMLFEGLGFGCGSGPLTGRYLPPIGGFLYFLLPGTIKRPTFPGSPLIGGHRRTLVDVAAYATTVGVLLWALTSPTVERSHLLALLGAVVALTLVDRTAFLVFRSEHYLSVAICLMFADWIAGSKVVWMAIWWWAATSKVNGHFPSVMGVMTSNAPITRGTPLRRWVYRDYPDDLRASRLAAGMAHFGTVVEYVVPAVLLFTTGGSLTWAALVVMSLFHLFILLNVPMGVPLEWNVIMVYGAWVLFGTHAEVATWSIGDGVLWAWLIGFHAVLPLYGSLFPRRVSFLLSMRYYAGNWPYSVWLFRKGTLEKLDRIRKVSPLVDRQLGMLYDEHTITMMLAKVIAFRHMHVLGRALHTLVPRAVADVDDYDWLDGELVAGLVLGWNFGDGHLSQGLLLRAVQAECGFAPGELRCVFVESQPLFGDSSEWEIHDAATGRIASGSLLIAELEEAMPWPTAA